MRLAFMGTPEFSAPVLGELVAAGHDIAVVYTRPPQPSGRGHRLKKSPVHLLAEKFDIEVRTPENFKSGDDLNAMRALDLDVAIVAAYGLIVPQGVLDAPRHGCLNLHASILPRWRGAAPIQRAIMAGDKQTGVQVMRMEKGLDTGPILLSETTPIHDDDTAATLHDRLSRIAAQLAPRALAALQRGVLIETPQPEEGVTYASKITAAEAKIDWSRPAKEIDWHIRGLSASPGAWFPVDNTRDRVKVLLSSLASGEGSAGEIIKADHELLVACGEGAVALKTLQRSGKRAQCAKDFLRGFALRVGDIF